MTPTGMNGTWLEMDGYLEWWPCAEVDIPPAFVVVRDEWTFQDGQTLRRILEVRVLD